MKEPQGQHSPVVQDRRILVVAFEERSVLSCRVTSSCNQQEGKESAHGAVDEPFDRIR